MIFQLAVLGRLIILLAFYDDTPSGYGPVKRGVKLCPSLLVDIYGCHLWEHSSDGRATDF